MALLMQSWWDSKNDILDKNDEYSFLGRRSFDEFTRNSLVYKDFLVLDNYAL